MSTPGPDQHVNQCGSVRFCMPPSMDIDRREAVGLTGKLCQVVAGPPQQLHPSRPPLQDRVHRAGTQGLAQHNTGLQVKNMYDLEDKLTGKLRVFF
jgi:hypothetical protein